MTGWVGILDSKIHILTSQCYKETLTALTLLLITDKRGGNGEVGNCDAGDGINFRINTKGENLLIYRIWQYFHFIAIIVVPMWFSVTILSSELISSLTQEYFCLRTWLCNSGYLLQKESRQWNIIMLRKARSLIIC